MKMTKHFKANFMIYLFVNLLLIFINFRHTPDVIWFHFPLIGWGIPILIMYLISIDWPKFISSPGKRMNRGFVIHLSVFVLVNLMLAITNLLYTPHFLWFIYIFLGWGSGLAAHYVYFRR